MWAEMRRMIGQKPRDMAVCFLLVHLLLLVLAHGLDHYSPSSTCRKLLKDKRLQRSIWDMARHEIGLRPLPAEGPNRTFSLFSFFSQSHLMRVFNISNQPVVYHVVYKGGNNNINKNLERQEKLTKGNALSHIIDLNARNRAMLKYFGISDIQNIKSFTYVREPLGHFLSGLREYYGWKYDKSKPAKFSLPPSAVRDDLISLLNCRLAPAISIHSVMHLYRQAGILTLGTPTFVGRLENFTAGWSSVNKIYGLHMHHVRSLGIHLSSSDPYNVSQSFEVIVKDNPSFMSAICALLLIDYECFQYEVSGVCRAVHQRMRAELV